MRAAVLLVTVLLVAVALTLPATPAAAAGASGSGASGGAACAWRTTAQKLTSALAQHTDPQAARLREVLVAALATGSPCPPASTSASGAGARPYFGKAAWLWEPIPDQPVLDGESASFAAALSSGDHIADTDSFGVTMVGPDQITAATPRRHVATTASWCAQPLTDVPLPDGTQVPSGSDGHVTVLDTAKGLVHSLWTAADSGDSWTAGCGSSIPLDGDGRETGAATSTGSDISRWAAVIRTSEIVSGDIPHALFFSTNMARAGECRYPANKTDGENFSHSGVTIPEGARVQLDPSVDVASLGLAPGPLAIATALQKYGAYVGDNGGARMAFIFERGDYTAAGLGGDFARIEGIPWDKLRVLATSTGTATPAGTCEGEKK